MADDGTQQTTHRSAMDLEVAASDGPDPLDTETVAMLRSLPGEDGGDVFAELVVLFRSKAAAELAAMREAAAVGDAGAVRRRAHSMRSASGNLGARTLARMLGALEEKARSGVPLRDITDFAAIACELARVEQALVAAARAMAA